MRPSTEVTLLTVLMVVWALTSAGTGLIGGFIHLFFMRTALGAMTAVDDPASSSLLSDYYPAKIRHKAFSWRLVAPVVGGAFGNVIDRVRFGAVVDFLDFSGIFRPYFFNYVFNVADAAISVGAVLLFVDQFLMSRQDKAAGAVNED